jgi:cytochrome c-type biogenesis protein
LFGLIFTTILEVSLTNIVGIASPIAFGVLVVISFLLIFNVDISRFLPKARTRLTKSPWLSAFLYGLSFGAIVIPCNPAFIAVLFTTTATGVGFAVNIARFVVFGIGIGFPLLVIAAVSSARSDAIIDFLSRHKKAINRTVGGVMLGISLYYLIVVFQVFNMISC